MKQCSMFAWIAKTASVGAVAMLLHTSASAQEAVKDFGGEELVVQTLTGTAGKFFRDIAEPFEKKYNAKLEMFESLSSDTVAKMRANAGDQESDVWMVAETWATVLEKEKLLEPLSVKGVPALEQMLPTARAKNDAFMLMSLAAMNITYNKTKISPADLPKTWEDLADPKYKGRIILPAANSTFAVMLIEQLNRIGGGTMKNIDPAIAQLNKIAPNVMTYWTSFDQNFNLMNSGQAWIAVSSSDRTIDQALKGAPISAFYPESGTVLIGNAVGISQGTKRKELAEAYINYLLSKDVQKIMADRIGQIPTIKGVDVAPEVKALLPQGSAMTNSVSPNWSDIAANQAQWIDRYTKEIVSK
ncbi:extracellular solute-binding protein [Neorhizobium galegae]|uniref:extracellular solute-binding protein n=1 Tax=Neorhizobium galegae TaxID=399 RepID=UPI00127F5F4D|nr:extracellular solute-binding protein [Neorhizobium galegae]KAA9384110.1 extracellular solute-binding protein [Neorhizobium galegae]MCM2498760.1 extracellular solute-binding protein [Neorhizobium galegae]